MIRKTDLLMITFGVIVSAMANGYPETVSVHISENSVTTKNNQPSERIIVAPSKTDKMTQTYVLESEKRIDPHKTKDANDIATSVEFEVYQISENYHSHTVYESPAGICHGYLSRAGVDVTDSTTYYVPGSEQKDYYASLVGAKVSKNSGVENVQYAPVFNIQEARLSHKVRAEEAKYGKDMATEGVTEKSKILSQKVCH